MERGGEGQNDEQSRIHNDGSGDVGGGGRDRELCRFSPLCSGLWDANIPPSLFLPSFIPIYLSLFPSFSLPFFVSSCLQSSSFLDLFLFFFFSRAHDALRHNETVKRSPAQAGAETKSGWEKEGGGAGVGWRCVCGEGGVK